MEIPSRQQFSRIFGHLDALDDLPASQISGAIASLRASGEPEEVLSYLRTNYALPSPPDFELAPGKRIANRYTIREKIGSGGMGVVYRATQDRTGRDVALKLIQPRLQSRALLERFEEEIVTLGRLDHPGIVHIFDADTHEDMMFFTMQLLDGKPLHRHLRDATLTKHQKLDLIIRLCAAIRAAHDGGVIHRDLKPSNISIDRRTGKPTVLDFGLATLASQSFAAGEHQISGMSGTPDYMSPEQFLGTAGEFGGGQSVDVYALGIIAFEILTGHSPYDFSEDSSWADKRRTVLETSPRRLEGEPELDRAVRKAISKNPATRYFTVSAFAKALHLIRRQLASPEDSHPQEWHPALRVTIPSTESTIEEQNGDGGTGQILSAQLPDLEEERVFKCCKAPGQARSLGQEPSLLRLLKEQIEQPPNIVRLHDVSLDDPPFFLAMNLVHGGGLLTWARAKGGIAKVPFETRIDIIAQAATTIQAAHAAGILHGNLKPSKLLIEELADGIKVYVADFAVGPTKTGRGEPSSDIHSLGLLLYQALVGNFDQPLTVDWSDNIDDPLLQDDLRQCFSGSSEERFTSAGQLANNLKNLAQRRAEKAQQARLARRQTCAANRRGMLPTAALAVMIIAFIACLASFSFAEVRRAGASAPRRVSTTRSKVSARSTPQVVQVVFPLVSLPLVGSFQSLLASLEPAPHSVAASLLTTDTPPVTHRASAPTEPIAGRLEVSAEILTKRSRSRRMKPTLRRAPEAALDQFSLADRVLQLPPPSATRGKHLAREPTNAATVHSANPDKWDRKPGSAPAIPTSYGFALAKLSQ